ncbi:PTS glucose transporter subunit IIA [Paenibacillus sp. 2TAB23]|uniref:PTS sugar transporter subunit IIA n=1 Tax=Paenibacillus sp. 2TAB23 TaxID=3233004 RepID=UPI003F9CC696
MLSKWLQQSKQKLQSIELIAPLTGEAVLLSEVPDEAFGKGEIGNGFAIVPTEGKLIAPIDATVMHIIQTAHAIILEHKSGVQILMHIGINTVGMQGRGFKPLISNGAAVKAGQTLIEFDLALIENEGYSPITPIVVANGEVVASMECRYGKVSAGEPGAMFLKLLG